MKDGSQILISQFLVKKNHQTKQNYYLYGCKFGWIWSNRKEKYLSDGEILESDIWEKTWHQFWLGLEDRTKN